MIRFRIALTLLGVPLLLAFADVAPSDQDELYRLCYTVPLQDEFVELKLSACTTLVDSGRFTGDALASLFVQRGALYGVRNHLALALEDFDRAILLSPHAAGALLERGVAYVYMGLNVPALSDLSEAIRLDPKLAAAYTMRGAARVRVGQYDGAIQDVYYAILLNPSLAEAYQVRGLAYLFTHQETRAIAEFDEAIRLRPSFAGALLARGNAYTILKQFDRAVADYEQAIIVQPDFHEAIVARDSAKAQAARERAPDRPNAQTARPQAAGLSVQGAVVRTPSRAIGRTHDCSSYYPDLSRRLLEVGDVLVRYDVGGDGAISNVVLGKSSGSDRLDQAAVLCVATQWRNTAMMEGNAPVASPGHEAIIRYNMDLPTDGSEYVARGATHVSIGEYRRATADFDQAISVQPSYSEAFYGRGLANLMLGEYARAIQDFDTAIRLNPKYDDAIGALDLAKWSEAHATGSISGPAPTLPGPSH